MRMFLLILCLVGLLVTRCAFSSDIASSMLRSADDWNVKNATTMCAHESRVTVAPEVNSDGSIQVAMDGALGCSREPVLAAAAAIRAALKRGIFFESPRQYETWVNEIARHGIDLDAGSIALFVAHDVRRAVRERQPVAPVGDLPGRRAVTNVNSADINSGTHRWQKAAAKDKRDPDGGSKKWLGPSSTDSQKQTNTNHELNEADAEKANQNLTNEFSLQHIRRSLRRIEAIANAILVGHGLCFAIALLIAGRVVRKWLPRFEWPSMGKQFAWPKKG